MDNPEINYNEKHTKNNQIIDQLSCSYNQECINSITEKSSMSEGWMDTSRTGWKTAPATHVIKIKVSPCPVIHVSLMLKTYKAFSDLMKVPLRMSKEVNSRISHKTDVDDVHQLKRIINLKLLCLGLCFPSVLGFLLWSGKWRLKINGSAELTIKPCAMPSKSTRFHESK